MHHVGKFTSLLNIELSLYRVCVCVCGGEAGDFNFDVTLQRKSLKKSKMIVFTKRRVFTHR